MSYTAAGMAPRLREPLTGILTSKRTIKVNMQLVLAPSFLLLDSVFGSEWLSPGFFKSHFSCFPCSWRWPRDKAPAGKTQAGAPRDSIPSRVERQASFAASIPGFFHFLSTWDAAMIPGIAAALS